MELYIEGASTHSFRRTWHSDAHLLDADAQVGSNSEGDPEDFRSQNFVCTAKIFRGAG
ncbi:hypothetical protein ACEYW6_33935 [Nostoc sp. UIC 10607]